ncbi:MAG: hypothetical protein ABIA21_03265, partial [Candidatus Aenigmatarchaeota archaeon]
RKVLTDFSEKWKKKFKRTIPILDTFMTEDAYTIIVVYGPNSGNAMLAVNELRQKGEKVGLVRIHLFRPWPQLDIEMSLKTAKKVAVVDNQVSIGAWSALYPQIKSSTSAACSNFIFDKVVSVKEFIDIYNRIKSSEKEERIWMV